MFLALISSLEAIIRRNFLFSSEGMKHFNNSYDIVWQRIVCEPNIE